MGRPRTGSIIERGDKLEVWVGRNYAGTFDKSDRVTAEAVRDEWLKREQGKGPRTFSVFFLDWMRARELGRRVRGVQKERSIARAHIETAPWFDLPMRLVTTAVLQKWVGALLKTSATHAITRKGKVVERRKLDRKLSRKTIANTLRLVSRCFDYAVSEDKAKVNPAKGVILPPAATKRRDGQLIVHLTGAEVRKLFKHELPPLQRAVFAVAVYGGLREGEIWGLRWQDVDLSGPRPCVRVRRSYSGDVKSDTSVRDVPLLEPARAALAAWKAAQEPTPIAGLVFPADHGGCHHPSYTAGWRDHRQMRGDRLVTHLGWRARAGIARNVTFHDLRHTCGCHLVQGTWTPRPLRLEEVKEWLGHSSITVTERHYAKLVPGNLHDAIAPARGRKSKTGSKPGDEVDE